MTTNRWRGLLSAALLFLATAAGARIISYAPYTNRGAWPLTQGRENRYFVLLEDPGIMSGNGELVRYDSRGLEEPQVILTGVRYMGGAVRERNGVSTILVQMNASNGVTWKYSSDSGATWKTVQLPSAGLYAYDTSQTDVGGPWVRWRRSQLRTGSDATPFVLAAGNALYAVDADGSTRTLLPATSGVTLTLAGRSRDGSEFLVRNNAQLQIIDTAGHVTTVGGVAANADIEGWITPTDDVYLDMRIATGTTADHRIIRFAATGSQMNVLTTTAPEETALFAIPTYDFTGAWLIKRSSGQPTVLYRQSGTSEAVEQWSDITSPQIEALHAGSSGTSLLLQAHRPRTIDPTQIFRDPALTIWHIGNPAPRFYDELFMNEQNSKAFVHLSVDNAANGEPFVFDSGPQLSASVIPSPVSGGAPSGGSDVVQEWGVVRAALTQKLVLPGMSHIDGAFGSHWQSDVVIHNPSDSEQQVEIEYIATGDRPVSQTTTITLAANEIRVIPDALKALFNVTSGGGAFIVIPDDGVNVTSRTYVTTDKGTYGFGMNGIDFYAGAASPRFPLSFSGAFPGANFRTNLVITDTSGRGSETATSGAGILGAMGISNVLFSAPANGQQQYNGISFQLGLGSNDNGALVVAPTHGTAIASVIAIDNRTNDPTYFPPDIPATTTRTIPAIGHLDGANGSKFRSDLYLYNPSTVARGVLLQAKMWDSNDFITPVTFTLLPGEARVIPDALQKLFGRTGIARLRFQSFDGLTGEGVRVTSRTYSVDDNGGTYGFLMPPLNNFQMAAAGDTLEILGVVGGSGFRTNLGLIDTNATQVSQMAQAKVEIFNETGKSIDSFTVAFFSAGGTQLNDIFHARGLGNGPAAALIRITPITGTIGAYATMNDNGTNDPTYLAANLGAH